MQKNELWPHSKKICPCGIVRPVRELRFLHEVPTMRTRFAYRTRISSVYRLPLIAAAIIVFWNTIAPVAAQMPLVPTAGPATEAPADPAGQCAIEVARQERLYGIPARLLHAISLAESGRYDSNVKAVRAWPWTVMAEGRGRYLSSKQEAIAEVRVLQAKGVRNIDVGCMQVNLRAHPNAFETLDEAFEPATNVAYSARFLSSLYDTAGNWTLAASYYHSQTPHLAAAYRERLVKIWEREKGAGSQFDDLPQNNFFQTARRPNDLPTGKSAHALAKQERTEAERLEAKRIADAYREARIKEYQYKRAELQAARSAKSFLPSPSARLSTPSPAPALPETKTEETPETAPIPPPFDEPAAPSVQPKLPPSPK